MTRGGGNTIGPYSQILRTVEGTIFAWIITLGKIRHKFGTYFFLLLKLYKNRMAKVLKPPSPYRMSPEPVIEEPNPFMKIFADFKAKVDQQKSGVFCLFSNGLRGCIIVLSLERQAFKLQSFLSCLVFVALCQLAFFLKNFNFFLDFL